MAPGGLHPRLLARGQARSNALRGPGKHIVCTSGLLDSTRGPGKHIVCTSGLLDTRDPGKHIVCTSGLLDGTRGRPSRVWPKD